MCALEVGTYGAGSLHVLSRFCQHVGFIYVDLGIPGDLGNLFGSIAFHAGNSAKLLSSALRFGSKSSETLDFVLIDGDHSTDGVRLDINELLTCHTLVTSSC
jgi:hypothetical protein